MLAAGAPADSGTRWLDVGAGVGAAALCLAKRLPGFTCDGLEVQGPLVALARENAARNRLEERAAFYVGDVHAPPAPVVAGGYDGVITNPPFFDNAEAIRAPQGPRAASCIEVRGDLNDWVQKCLALLKPRGWFVIVQRADRLDDLLAALSVGAGAIHVAPLWPKAGRAAKLVLAKAQKGAQGALSLRPGLILHEPVDAGRAPQTPEADAILRQGRPFVW